MPQPRTRALKLALHRPHVAIRKLGDLFCAQARKAGHVQGLDELLTVFCEFFESLVDGQDLLGVVERKELIRRLGQRDHLAVTLRRLLRSVHVHHDLPHRPRRDGKEVPAVVELLSPTADELFVRLVDQHRRLNVLPDSRTPQLGPRNHAQLVVDEHHYVVEALRITRAVSPQQRRDLVRVLRCVHRITALWARTKGPSRRIVEVHQYLERDRRQKTTPKMRAYWAVVGQCRPRLRGKWLGRQNTKVIASGQTTTFQEVLAVNKTKTLSCTLRRALTHATPGSTGNALGALTAALLLLASPQAEAAARAQPMGLDWHTDLKHFQVDSEKFVGQRFAFECPEQTKKAKKKSVYGTNVYSSDSPICVAALHAGVIERDGGRVTVQLNPGVDRYVGSKKNGVSSQSRPATRRSFVFISKPFARGLAPAQREHAPRIQWDTKFTSTGLANRKLVGQHFVFKCPKAPANLKGRRVYGTDRYAFNSFVCLAAVHAGRLTRDGGFVTIQLVEPDGRLVGSMRHGVESKNGPAGHRQLVFR